MVDWRGEIVKSQRRTNQVTGEGSKHGMFTAYLDATSGDDQTATMTYAGGARDIPLPMPYDGNVSWIRAIPDVGVGAIGGYRADVSEPIFINYLNTDPSTKLNDYDNGNNIYRRLAQGEIEINSSGMAQSYYCQRSILEQRAGPVRQWLDQDRLESGAKAPIHTRQLWEYKSAPLTPGIDYTGTFILLGDEERFGAVRRPYNLLADPTTIPPTPRSGAAAAAGATAAAAAATANANLALAAVPPNTTLAAQLTQLAEDLGTDATLLYSFNYFDYPYPNFTTPTGIVNPATVTTEQAAAAAATAGPALAAGNFEPRVFAKEYVRIINNPLYNLASLNPQLAAANPALVTATSVLQNPKLIDIREGQVFDDECIQTLSPHGAYLRASYNYFTPVGDATSFTIDEVGNVSWQLSSLANFGWNVNIPSGGMTVTCTSGMSLTCALGDTDIVTTIGSIGLDSSTDINLTSKADSSFTTGADFSHTVVAGDYSLTVTAGNYASTVGMNMSLVATANFSASATNGTMILSAPYVYVGKTPTQSMVLGDLLVTWLDTLITALQTAAPTGNLGAPVPFISDPAFAASLEQLQTQTFPLKSQTVKVSP